MYQIAKTPIGEREILFRNAAEKAGRNQAVIEKDFWVCLTLDYLFHKSPWQDRFAFKGGTSLSKVYNLIGRFSEDIDLIIDWRVLDYTLREPWENRSNTKQQKFIDESRTRLFSFLDEEFLPVFRAGMSEILGAEANVYIASDDAGTVCFEYPGSFHEDALQRSIRLEIGALAAWTPTQMATIEPDVAAYYPQIFSQSTTDILTTTAERSFWEKATILHQEAFRPEQSSIPSRYSRHYYDVYCMAKTDVKEKAMAQPELLEEVAGFKQKFYPRKWAQYELAKLGTLKLMPAKHSIRPLQEDYVRMRPMIYGDYPNFEEILNGIETLEREINKK